MGAIKLSDKQPIEADLALPTHDSSHVPPKRRSFPTKLIALLLAGSLFPLISTHLLFPSPSTNGPTTQSVCQQSTILTPRGNVSELYNDKSKERIIDWLSGAVQIPTEAYDDMRDVEGDGRFKVFRVFHECMSFPSFVDYSC
jgi:Gly-Xaa carboxypeptidase